MKTDESSAQNDPPAEHRRSEPPAHLDKLAYDVIGAAIEVHRHLGPGLPETFYMQALALELEARAIPFARQVPFEVLYKSHPIGTCRVDLLIGEELVVELKAVEALAPVHKAQLVTYLRIGAFQLGLLINFNVAVLREGVRRVIWSG